MIKDGCGGNCAVSTGIHGGLTVGHGKLDNYGYWEHPCGPCARAMEKKLPDYGTCWPWPDEAYLAGDGDVDWSKINKAGWDTF